MTVNYPHTERLLNHDLISVNFKHMRQSADQNEMTVGYSDQQPNKDALF